MAWYNAGTVTVTNGSTVVTGAGTDFVTNVAARDALLVAGGNPLEIAAVQSATQLTLASPWLGATGGGQSYKVQPTVGIYVDIALRALGMLTPFQAVLDGIGQGLVGAGSAGAPGVRFLVDQDTGIRRAGENALTVVTGGADRATFDGAGNLLLGSLGAAFAPNGRCVEIKDPGGQAARLLLHVPGVKVLSVEADNGGSMLFYDRTAGAERARLDNSGNLLVGTVSGSNHTITKSGLAQGGVVLQIDGGAGSGVSVQVRRVNANAFNGGQSAALMLGNDTVTGRSVSAGGTINASGADYAEYLVKADGCGTIAKGDVCGVDRDGRLTRSWADAVRYVVKSTDPAYVGGDSWAAHLPERPTLPGEPPIAPARPAPATAAELPAEPVRSDAEEEIDFIRRMAGYLVAVSSVASAAAADRDALAAYHAAAAAYPAAKAAHDAAVTAYEAALAEWEQALEEARWTVDRIAFSGQVPVNVTEEALAVCEGALEDGEAVYLVAIARGGGIGAQAVREGDMTLPLYMRRLGAVWAIRDGRPWLDVQHG